MTERFRVLRMLGELYKVLAYLGLLLGVAAFGYELLRPDVHTAKEFDTVKVVSIAVGTVVQFVVFYGLSQAVALLLSIGATVEVTAKRTERLLASQAQRHDADAGDEADGEADDDADPPSDTVIARCERCDMRVPPGKKLCTTCRRALDRAG